MIKYYELTDEGFFLLVICARLQLSLNIEHTMSIKRLLLKEIACKTVNEARSLECRYRDVREVNESHGTLQVRITTA